MECESVRELEERLADVEARFDVYRNAMGTVMLEKEQLERRVADLETGLKGIAKTAEIGPLWKVREETRELVGLTIKPAVLN